MLTSLLAGLAACSTGEGGGGPSPSSLLAAPYDATGHISLGLAGDGDGTGRVDPDKPLTVTSDAGEGRITDVVASDDTGRAVPGELSADGTGWRSTAPLAAGAEYTVRVRTENGSGAPGRGVHTFRTRASDAERLTASFGPEPGTYGAGQPITAELNRKVTDPRHRAMVESALAVTSDPAVSGSWHWVDGEKLHYRPRDYWPAGTEITVRSTLEGVHIRNGLRGGSSEDLRLTIGDRIEAVADIRNHTMTVLRNGEKLRTLPMTTGKEGFRTRNGKKVVLAQESFVQMRSSSVGIPAGSAESYDMPVHWATRLTWSGEYVHGAPWSAGSHGVADVSHGCTGLGTKNARWFFDLVKPGDIVEHVNGYGEDMAAFGNGFGDWNLSWEEWRAGSALHTGGDREDDGRTAYTLSPMI